MRTMDKGFLSRWLRICYRILEISKIQNGGSNMAARRIFFRISMKNWTMGFLRSLITNLLSDFENFKNSKCRIKHGDRKTFKCIPMKNWTTGFLGGADHASSRISYLLDPPFWTFKFWKSDGKLVIGDSTNPFINVKKNLSSCLKFGIIFVKFWFCGIVFETSFAG